MVGFYVHQILDFVWGDDFLCYVLSGVILEVVADGNSLDLSYVVSEAFQLSANR